MVRALADGEDRHRLEDADGRDIGWIVRRAIGFRGFATQEDAIDAALASWRALEAALNREYAGRPKRDVSRERIRVVHDGASEWVSDGQLPLARLQRPHEDTAEASFAIELQLPSYATEGVTVAAAQVLARVIAPHVAEDRLTPATLEAGT